MISYTIRLTISIIIHISNSINSSNNINSTNSNNIYHLSLLVLLVHSGGSSIRPE
jgi:hypothetical protein